MKRKILLPLVALLMMTIGLSSCYVGPGYYGHRHWHHYHGYYR